MLPSFATITVTRLRAAQTTERGATIRDWDHASEAQVAGCSVQQDTTSSDYAERANTIQSYTLWAPVDADILRGDRIVANGTTFDVVGVPFSWYSPRGTVDHLTCKMTEWVG